MNFTHWRDLFDQEELERAYAESMLMNKESVPSDQRKEMARKGSIGSQVTDENEEMVFATLESGMNQKQAIYYNQAETMLKTESEDSDDHSSQDNFNAQELYQSVYMKNMKHVQQQMR